MADLTNVPDPEGAKTAAHRLNSALSNLDDVVSDALDLVKTMEAQSPLFGDDEGGRKFRSNYTDSSTKITESTRTLAEGLGTVGAAVNKAINGTTTAEDDNTRAIPA
ncbi:MAG: hypothetical protein HOV77_14605 [Hamadaea sp.]|uniref:hypothetical protein n=1 Tax=Hamadaea sp. TaxID=2024425 RepID=UPI0017C51936|nr:hypothetical protein [Hamadaea sp.]NUT20414.1 hypothetical protein [Hamadaea sp.]